MLTAACAEPPPPGPRVDAVEQTVVVERKDIESILVVTGVVRATPSMSVSSTASGTLHHAVEDGGRPDAGQVLGTVADSPVLAPTGHVVITWLVADGQQVGTHTPVAELEYDGLSVTVDVPALESFRLYSEPTAGQVVIEGGPAGVECPAARSAPDAHEENPADVGVGGVTPSLRWECLLPLDTEAFPGLPAKVGLRTGAVRDVVSAPVECVLGSTGQGVVFRLVDGSPQRVTVDLGVSNGVDVEVRSGLAPGDEILASPPGIG